jgi:hypothetical protein
MSTGWVFDLVFVVVVAVVAATVFYLIWLADSKEFRDVVEDYRCPDDDCYQPVPPVAPPYPHVRPLPREAYDWKETDR